MKRLLICLLAVFLVNYGFAQKNQIGYIESFCKGRSTIRQSVCTVQDEHQSTYQQQNMNHEQLLFNNDVQI